MDPYSSLYIIPNNSPHNPFPIPYSQNLVRTAVGSNFALGRDGAADGDPDASPIWTTNYGNLMSYLYLYIYIYTYI